MNDKEKSIFLANFYGDLANNNAGYFCTMTMCPPPHLLMTTSELKSYKVNPPKPTKRIIDLSLLVGSDIDMEFCYGKDFSKWNVGKLIKILTGLRYSTATTDLQPSKICIIREKHWISWQGGECPLPEGLIIEIQTRKSSESSVKITDYRSDVWGWYWNAPTCDNRGDIIAFKITGVADGWRYEWDKEE